ncbi:MAG: M20/M25/M40 family metallo-hydrolase [Bacillota bacterium]|nr:M20/M25/M40 family metallo-hydrolase [Bacillota bacterium]
MPTKTLPSPLTPQELDELASLATRILQDLIRLDTSNPPGNEIIAARYLHELLAAEGIAGEILEPEPGRGNVVARLKADTDTATAGKGLLLLSHLDVVPAEPDKWDVPPFSGEIRDGEVWGRGAIDMKGLAALEAAIFITVKRRGLALRRDLVLAATANEEAGGWFGARWIAENRLELVDADAAINEGGGIGLEFGGKTVYTVQTAEKAPCPVTVTAHGRPGHASVPSDDNAVVTLSRALVAIGSRRLPPKITSSFRGFVETLAASFGPVLGALARQMLNPQLAEQVIDRVTADPLKTAAFKAMIRNTATPTIVKAGYKVNVIPGAATAELDCRLLPGSSPEELVKELEDVLAAAGLAGTVKLEAARTDAPTLESPFAGELVERMADAIRTHAAGAPLVPFLMPGATDGRFLRPKGIPVYGFSPMLPGEPFGNAHGHNERIGLASIRFGAQVLWDVITGYCAAG